jgi:hypothetical protein
VGSAVQAECHFAKTRADGQQLVNYLKVCKVQKNFFLKKQQQQQQIVKRRAFDCEHGEQGGSLLEQKWKRRRMDFQAVHQNRGRAH